MNETNRLLRSLLVSHVVARADSIFAFSQAASHPQYVKSDGRPGVVGTYENINPNRAKSWDQCLQEAADSIATHQDAVIQLLQERGLLTP